MKLPPGPPNLGLVRAGNKFWKNELVNDPSGRVFVGPFSAGLLIDYC